MKKFHVKDEDGEVFEVEEIDEAPETVEIEEVKDDLALTDEEISALKGLAAVSEKLMKLVADVEDACKDEEEEEEEKVEDDEEKEEEKIEEVIDSTKDNYVSMRIPVRVEQAIENVANVLGIKYDISNGAYKFSSASDVDKIIEKVYQQTGIKLIKSYPTVITKNEYFDSEEDDEEKEAKACDSKKSFGAIESKSKSKDSLADSLDVENAWAKRYGGK